MWGHNTKFLAEHDAAAPPPPNDLLAKAEERAEARGARRVHGEVRTGEPAETILTVAKEHDADAIVLGRRGQRRLAGLLLGSVSQKVMALARCPVAVVP